MTTIVAAFILFMLAMAGLAIGVLFGRGPLKGSCGGDQAVKTCPACAVLDKETPS